MVMKNILKFGGVLSAFLVARLLPFNLIVGSVCAKFSWSSVVAPVVGMQLGFLWSLIGLISFKISTSKSLFLLLLHRLPLLFGVKAFTDKNAVISIAVPLVCMGLFIVHPTGSQVWIYSLYWLIPVFIFGIQDTEYARSLSSSFVMHAVGSVVWLYTAEISSAVWLALIPVVACERLLMAGGIVVSNRIATFCLQKATSLQLSFLYRKAR